MQVALQGGAYTARSLIANAQRCVNLYPENNPSDAPFPVTHYPTPGLTPLVQGPVAAVRCTYTATNGDLYVVIGDTVYFVSRTWVLTSLGTVNQLPTPVCMVDNGTTIVVVDGTSSGWQIDMTSRAMTVLSDPAFYGATRGDFMDTFFVFNKPGTPQWYVSNSNAVTFDPLYFADKAGAADPLATIACVNREVWLLGTYTSEIWFDAGAADFPFQILPGAFVEHGVGAPYSLAKSDGALYWLSQDYQGNAIVLRAAGYQAQRISTHAIENEFLSYSDISDAIGYTYQQEGHTFYVLSFPTADATWVFDAATQLWHERASIDSNGNLHRQRVQLATNAYGSIVGGDYENGWLYRLDLNNYTDNGTEVPRIRSFPHMLNDGKRVIYNQFLAAMGCGQLSTDDPPMVSLRWSDTGGETWGNPVMRSMGATGQFITQVQWLRLGVARDRVFELSWSVPVKTALNGAFVRATPCAT